MEESENEKDLYQFCKQGLDMYSVGCKFPKGGWWDNKLDISSGGRKLQDNDKNRERKAPVHVIVGHVRPSAI